MPVVNITKQALFVDDHLGRLAAEFEEFHFLPVTFQNCMIFIGQADEGQVIFYPVFFKFTGIFRAHRNNNCVMFCKTIVVPAQLRQVFLAEVSVKAPVQNQQNMFFMLKICKADWVPLKVSQGKIWSCGIQCYLGHQ